MENILGLLNAENVPIAVVHYSAPAIVILFFLFSSSFQSIATTSEASSNGTITTGTSASTSAHQQQLSRPSTLTRWLFVLAVLTFVYFYSFEI